MQGKVIRETRGLLILTVALATATTAGAVPQLRRYERWMVDDQERVVLLHGVNAVWKLDPYYPPDEAKGFTAADAQWLADNGFNSVRLGVIFAGVMPETPGVVDADYLDAAQGNDVNRVVQLLAAQKIWILLDFHQDMFSERYKGEGFPAWAVDDDGLPEHYFFGFPGNYFTPGVMRAFDNFWANKNDIWDHYRDAWKAVAAKWKDQPYLMGYDLMNEPWPGTDWPSCANPVGCPVHDAEKLQKMQEHVLEGIREVDLENIVWFEPNVIFNSGAESQLAVLRPITPADPNLGLSWHDYCLPGGFVQGFGAEDVPTCDQFHRRDFDNAEKVIPRMPSTSLVTEFGATDDLTVIEQVTALGDEYLTGWQYWHYKNWSDPTTVSQESGAQGLFEKDDDLTTLKLDKAKLLIRPYPQATAGIPKSLFFDRDSKLFRYVYAPRQSASGPTEIFVPVSLHYPAGYEAMVTGATITSPPDATRLTLEADSGADEVTVELLPPATP